jgi:hypothetical protein
MDNIKKEYCCNVMQARLQDLDCPLQYMASIRYYTMSVPQSHAVKNIVWPDYDVSFCPYCGAKLPNDLVDERVDILEQEYGITDPYIKQKKLIPAEFKTDEWWKKRGL